MDKGATRTNWLRRPLSPVQLQYAAGDVWYALADRIKKMQIELAQSPWLQAVIDDCQLAISKTSKLDDRDLNKAYLEIPNVWKLNPLELARLQLLAKWRQKPQWARNLALSYVVKSDNLWKWQKQSS